MAVTIQTLAYQDTTSAIHRYMRDNFSWLYSKTVIDGVSGKATINSLDITGNLLKDADCVVDAIDIDWLAKEIELSYYNLSFPVEHCDLRRTWLSAFANKFQDEEEVFVYNLIPYLSEKIGDEVRTKITNDMLTEAGLDVGVTKVTLAGAITTPASANTTVLEFIAGLPQSIKDDVYDKHSYEGYSINVSPVAYELLAEYYGDKVSDYGVSVSGIRVVADKVLSGNSMYCTTSKNCLVVFDSAEDLNRVKIVDKPWINTSYIVTGLGVKGSYVSNKEIVISN